MAFVYEKWFEFPKVVKYGESGVILSFDDIFMVYGNGGGMRIKAEMYLVSPEIFEVISSEVVRRKAQMSRSGFSGPGKIIGWVASKQPETKKK